MEKIVRCLAVLALLVFGLVSISNGNGVEEEDDYSVVGDPGMKRDDLRVLLEAWNYCNEVGEEAPNMGSPRVADCFSVEELDGTCHLHHLVNESDNKLGVGDPFPGQTLNVNDTDSYALEKEDYLGSKCEVRYEPWAFPSYPWQFWKIMVKNGNMDTHAALCPTPNATNTHSNFSCFGKGCMNQPLIFHNYTSQSRDENERIFLSGSFFGTYDLEADFLKGVTKNISYYSVTWERVFGSSNSWLFHYFLRTSQKYPSLTLNLRSDSTHGNSGGYHYETRGMTKEPLIERSPKFKVKFRLEVLKGGGPKARFNLLEMGSCWKNNGQPCDGNTTINDDVTRYVKMIISPNTTALCSPSNLKACPPYHTLSNGTLIHRNDTANFPYGAYHSYCGPPNAKHLEEPYDICNPYDNLQPQEIVQILPHPTWGEYGFPTKQGDGWIGEARNWELEAGKLSQKLYFYQDPGTTPARRPWSSIDLGSEIVNSPDEVAEWTVSDFDIVVPRITISYR